MNVGDIITDGNVRWTVRDSRATATSLQAGLMSAEDKKALDSLKAGGVVPSGGGTATSYELPVASTSELGGVKAGGTGITISSSGVIGIDTPGGTAKYLRADGTWAQPPTSTSSGGTTTSYELPVASTSELGGVKAGGTGITISSSGVIGIDTLGGTTKYLRSDGSWQIPTIPVASTSELGGVKAGGTGITISSSGVIGIDTPGGTAKYLRADGTWAQPPTVAGTGSGTTTSYELPVASTSELGGVKAGGTGITISSSGVIGIDTPGGTAKYLRSDGQWASIASSSLATASSSVLGGVKVGTGLSISSAGVLTTNIPTVSTSAAGLVPKLPTGTSAANKYLTGAGTWDSLNVEFTDAQLGLTSTKIYNLFKDHVDAQPNTTLNESAMFLAADGVWRPFTVHPPSQIGKIVYDGDNHVPDWTEYGTDKFSISTVSTSAASVTTYYNGLASTLKALPLKTGTNGINAGCYVLQFKPINNYVWGTKASTAGGASIVGTQNPILRNWAIRKAENTITVSSKRSEAQYGTPVIIDYSTKSGQAVSIDGSNTWGLDANNNISKDAWGVSVTSDTSSSISASTEMTVYQKTKLKYLNRDAYFDLVVGNDEIDSTQPIIRYTMLRRSNWYTSNKWHKKLVNKINTPSFVIRSPETDNYTSSAVTLKFINTRIASTLDFWEIEEMSNEIIFTRMKTKLVRLKYTGSDLPVITTSNNLVKVQILEDYVDSLNIAANNNQELKCYSYYLKSNKDPSEFATKTQAFAGSAQIDTTLPGGTIYKCNNTDVELFSDFNNVKMDEVKYPILVLLDVDGAINNWSYKRWLFVETDYKYIMPKKNAYWNTSNPEPINHQISTEFVNYKLYRSLTLLITPMASSGSCTISIKPPAMASFDNVSDVLRMNVTINPNAATALTGYSGGDPNTLSGSGTNASLTAAITAFDNGTAAALYKVGDYIPFKFTKTVTLDSNDSITSSDVYKAILIGINHNSSSSQEYVDGASEAHKHHAGHFMIGKNVYNDQIGFYGKKMDASGYNIGGWPSTDLFTWLNSNDGIYGALPAQIKNAIKNYHKPTVTLATVSSNGTTTYNYSVSNDASYIWLLAKNEVYADTATSYVNPAEIEAVERYEYFKNANGSFFQKHSAPDEGTHWWSRSLRGATNNTKQYIRFRRAEEGQGQESACSNASVISGIVPCFVL